MHYHNKHLSKTQIKMVEHIQDLIKKKNNSPPWAITESASILRDLTVSNLILVIDFISSFEDVEGLIAKNKEHIEENNKKADQLLDELTKINKSTNSLLNYNEELKRQL